MDARCVRLSGDGAREVSKRRGVELKRGCPKGCHGTNVQRNVCMSRCGEEVREVEVY